MVAARCGAYAALQARRRVLPRSFLSPCRLVDKLMSRDIQRFIATEADRTNRSPKPPRVAPSMATTSHMPTQAMMEGYPRSSLIIPLDRERAPRRDSKGTRGEEEYFELYLRNSLALDPNVYTGSAELRGGAPPPSPQQVQHVSRCENPHGSCKMRVHRTTPYTHMSPSSIC